MTMVLFWIGSFLWAYTVMSCWWFVEHLGDKNRKERWYDRIILAPAYLIACIVGYFTK